MVSIILNVSARNVSIIGTLNKCCIVNRYIVSYNYLNFIYSRPADTNFGLQ